MKYAIYDKAADGYLTKMEFEVGYSEHTQFECGYNEYITEAQLLDTPKEAADAIVRIESFKFMDKGRFVVHSFDDTLKDQYIISKAGTPTKVVDSITVDLDGTINVKYGTMPTHWSATSLDYTVNRMFKLQNAASEIYTPWHDIFDIYKAVHVIDERECTHYQFIKVTEKGLEASNNGLRNELYNSKRWISELHSKVGSIKKEARNWKSLYENADADREELKNIIDIIHTDLVSATACNDLKDTLKAIYRNSGLDHISMENFLTAKDEICSIINHVITIMESRELNQNVAFSSAEEVNRAKKLANDIIDICEVTTDPFEVTLKKFSQLYEAIWIPDTNDDIILHAFKSILQIFSKLEACEVVLDSTHDMLTKATEERDKALERAEKFKGIANSVYGMTIPGRCCGKQLMADILSGKKIPISKDKYDSIITSLKLIDLSYEGVYGTMIQISPKPKPTWLPGLMNELKNLTE